MISDRRWYLTAEQDRVVEHGDDAAAFLLVGEGCELPDHEARRWGLIDSPEAPQPTEGDVSVPEMSAKERKAFERAQARLKEVEAELETAAQHNHETAVEASIEAEAEATALGAVDPSAPLPAEFTVPLGSALNEE